MRYNKNYVLEKVVVYYERKHKNIKNVFLVVIWNCYHFYKKNLKFTKNQDTFKILCLFKNDKQKKMLCIGAPISIYYNKL
jgi:hypothetical protein